MKRQPKIGLQRLRRMLADAADASKAPGMQAYMKSSMPYRGVPAPVLKKVCREFIAGAAIPTAQEWEDLVLHIWRKAKFREERYAAIALCETRSADAFQTHASLPIYEELIVTGAWWDFLDVLSSHCLGKLLRRYPKEMAKEMKGWSHCDDMWKRRASILCQLGFKKDTDLKLLYSCIAPSLSSPEFFLRKAIGWALRQYAWTDPAEVRRYVRAHERELSPLSKREALKNI